MQCSCVLKPVNTKDIEELELKLNEGDKVALCLQTNYAYNIKTNDNNEIFMIGFKLEDIKGITEISLVSINLSSTIARIILGSNLDTDKYTLERTRDGYEVNDLKWEIRLSNGWDREYISIYIEVFTRIYNNLVQKYVMGKISETDLYKVADLRDLKICRTEKLVSVLEEEKYRLLKIQNIEGDYILIEAEALKSMLHIKNIDMLDADEFDDYQISVVDLFHKAIKDLKRYRDLFFYYKTADGKVRWFSIEKHAIIAPDYTLNSVETFFNQFLDDNTDSINDLYVRFVKDMTAPSIWDKIEGSTDKIKADKVLHKKYVG
jgi:hypothetical protein